MNNIVQIKQRSHKMLQCVKVRPHLVKVTKAAIAVNDDVVESHI